MSITKKLASVFAGVVVAFVAFGMMASSASAISAQALMDMGLTAEQAAVISALFAEDEGSSCVAMDTSTTMGIQAAVNDMGYLPALAVDGVYGSGTRTGVAYLQTMVGAGADGVFGAQTRMAYEAYVAANCDEVEADVEEEEEEESNSSLSGGETSIEDINLDSEDDAEEGEEMHVATLEFDVEDADAMLNRLDFTFDNTQVLANNFLNTDTADDEPWDVFTTLTLMVDGEEIASEDIDEENDWLEEDNNPFEFRLSGIDFVAEEGDTVEVEVYLTSMNNVEDADSAEWILGLANSGMRFLDSEGLTSYYATGDIVQFNMDEEGGDEDIKIKSSSNDPESATLEVEDDDQSAWYEIFEFRLEAEENDIDLDDLTITIATVGSTYDNVVSDISIEIDGEEFDDISVSGGNSALATLVFDIDQDFTIDADDTVDVVVMVEFEREGVNYSAGQTVLAGVTAVSGEGADDVSDPSSLTGELHTLELSVAELSVATASIDKAEDDASGTISFEFTLDASDSDEDFQFDVATLTAVNGATDDVRFSLIGTNTAIANATLARIAGDATYAAGTYTIAEGEDATFALDVTFTTTLPTDNGTYRVTLDSVAGIDVDETSNGMTLSN